MFSRFYKFGLAISLGALPFVASAADELGKTSTFFKELLKLVEGTLIPIAFALAFLGFIYGVAKYIWSVGSEGKSEGKNIMVWGVIALAVMTSVWGIVRFLRSDLGISEADTASMKIPTIDRTP